MMLDKDNMEISNTFYSASRCQLLLLHEYYSFFRSNFHILIRTPTNPRRRTITASLQQTQLPRRVNGTELKKTRVTFGGQAYSFVPGHHSRSGSASVTCGNGLPTT